MHVRDHLLPKKHKNKIEETLILRFWEVAETSTMGIGLSLGLKCKGNSEGQQPSEGCIADNVGLCCRDFTDIYSCKLPEVYVLENLSSK